MLKRIKDGLTDLAPDVAEALGEGRAVVALEFDDHHARHALSAERRDGEGGRGDGACRGRCARRRSRSSTGGSRSDCRRTSSKGSAARNTSSRRRAATLPPRSYKHANAGTTVAATMAIAARAGIEVFATGGIGGVHRGAEQTFDISADLTELAAKSGRCRLRRLQVDPRYRKDAGISGDAGRAGRRLRHGRVSCLLRALERPQTRSSLRQRGRCRGHDPHGAKARVAERHPDRQSDSGGGRACRRPRSKSGSPQR